MSSDRAPLLARALLAFAVAVGLLAMHHLVVHGGSMHDGAVHAGPAQAVSGHVTPAHVTPAPVHPALAPTAAPPDLAESVLAAPLGGHAMLHDCPATLVAVLLLTIALFALGVLDDLRSALRAVLTRIRRIGRGPPPSPSTSRRLSALSILRV
ncbi:hypothetical protein G4X40_20555 [Rhodococcus sp. D2-41]|uniref:hypothetical protein n=1 Tax=Speluncibacter jeojiensis TaxID=2710754 RepID=UPI002410329C|nr:hypothetical protein [Rhodococcus sp. D2-41]MDG3012534.1 hypothetical protein [Rhodococcus sp. D2-41]